MKHRPRTGRYAWVPHEVRREQTESVVAYVVIGLSMTVVLAVMLFAAYRGFS